MQSSSLILVVLQTEVTLLTIYTANINQTLQKLLERKCFVDHPKDCRVLCCWIFSLLRYRVAWNRVFAVECRICTILKI
jgi:hypothetical protein